MKWDGWTDGRDLNQPTAVHCLIPLHALRKGLHSLELTPLSLGPPLKLPILCAYSQRLGLTSVSSITLHTPRAKTWLTIA